MEMVKEERERERERERGSAQRAWEAYEEMEEEWEVVEEEPDNSNAIAACVTKSPNHELLNQSSDW